MARHKDETGTSLHETKLTGLAGSPVTLSTVASVAGITVYDASNTSKPVPYVAKTTAAGDFVKLIPGHLAYYTYADAAARTGASGFVSDDIGKVAYQTDTTSYWVLTATTPTWLELTNTTVSGGSSNVNVATKTTTYTVTGTDGLLLGDASGGSFTMTLPAVSSNDGKIIYFKKSDSSANTVTIARAGSDLVDGATSYVLSAQYESITLIGDSTNSAWRIV